MDGIEENSFLEIDKQILMAENNFIFKNLPIYLLHYPKGIEVMKAGGTIGNISEDNYNIQHFCDSSSGSSGGPLLNLQNFKVIGIHKGSGIKGKNWNLGTLLTEPIKKLYGEIEKKGNKKNNILQTNNVEANKINVKKEENISNLNNINNIIYYNENIKDLKTIIEDSDYFEKGITGAFILITNLESLKLIREEIIAENRKDKNILFNLILGEFDLNKFKNFLKENKQFENCIQNTIIYTKDKERNLNMNIDLLKYLIFIVIEKI